MPKEINRSGTIYEDIPLASLERQYKELMELQFEGKNVELLKEYLLEKMRETSARDDARKLKEVREKLEDYM